MSVAYLEHALDDAGIVEIRHCAGPGQWRSGLFADIGAARLAIRALAGSGNLYSSLNRPGPGVRATDAMGARPLTDADISHVCRIPVDLDPVRPTGVMATAAELGRAIAARNRFVAAMRSIGWPQPALGMSGSGAHAIYRCLIPASAELREQMDAIYRGWREEFATEGVAFDPKVKNPSRIFRLYGTVNRKGRSSLERPHRRAEVVLPSRWQAVTHEQIARLAERYAAEQPRRASVVALTSRTVFRGSGDYRTLDAARWFRAAGLYKRPLSRDRHAVTCPWAHEHSTPDHPAASDTVLLPPGAPGMWPVFHCAHAHCEGRTLRDVMTVLGDPSAYCAQPYARERRHG